MNELWLRFDSWGDFPDLVNERAARFLAAGVALLALLGAVWGWLWIAPVLAAGFWLRVWAGPRWDPLARVAVWAAEETFQRREVAGPPKRFAQLLGAILMTAASLALLLGADVVVLVALGILFVLASFESIGGICFGCRIFAAMIKRGWIPESICERCRDWSGA